MNTSLSRPGLTTMSWSAWYGCSPQPAAAMQDLFPLQSYGPDHHIWVLAVEVFSGPGRQHSVPSKVCLAGQPQDQQHLHAGRVALSSMRWQLRVTSYHDAGGITYGLGSKLTKAQPYLYKLQGLSFICSTVGLPRSHTVTFVQIPGRCQSVPASLSLPLSCMQAGTMEGSW